MERRTFLAGTAMLAAADRPLRIGVVGIGTRGTYLLQTVLKLEGVQVPAVCDIRSERLAVAEQTVTAAGQPKPRTFTEWKRLLELKDLDAVVMALPCHLHAAAYLDAIAAGKDLYGEKPMCITLGQCDEVVSVAERSRQIVQIGFQRRADPRYIASVKQAHDGELGSLVEGRIVWSNAWGPLYGWFGRRKESGDWMVEQAVHGWDAMNWAIQAHPEQAAGFGRCDLFRDKQPERDAHDYYAATLEYENGVIVNIVHSWTAASKFNEAYIKLLGTRASVDFDSGLLSYRPELKLPDRFVSDAPKLDQGLLALRSFANSIRTRKPPIVGVREGREAVLAALLVRQAVYSKKIAGMGDIA